MKKNFLITFTIIFFIAIAIYGQETKLDSFQSSSSSSEHSVFSIPYDLKLSEPNDFSGGLFSTAISSGDFNGDGYPDVVVGEYYRNNQTGRVNVFLGGPTIDETPDLIISGNQFEENFGYSISLGGDINNDGYDDLIVGAPWYGNGRGRTYIYLGSSSINNSVDFYITGKNDYDYFGYTVNNEIDMNNDYYSEIVICSRGYINYSGRAYMFLGGAALDTTSDYVFTGENTWDEFGTSIANIGDVNGDNIDDLGIGAYRFSSFTGKVYIFYAGNSIDTTVDLNMTGEGTWNYFGKTLSTTGDINNDNFDDVIIGAYGYNNDNTGRAYLFYGGNPMDNTPDLIMTGESSHSFGKSVSTAGDVNNDNYDDFIVGADGAAGGKGEAYIFYGSASPDTLADITFSGEAGSVSFGASCAFTGDLNNDSYDDVIIGDYYLNNNNGRAYIYYGGNPMNNVADKILNPEFDKNYFGISVSDAGDVNNDGYDDLIVGAYWYDNSKGRAYIYYGGNPMNNTVDVTMTGESSNNRFGEIVSSIGDVNNDGYDDVIVTAPSYNSLRGKVYIYLGNNPIDNIPDITITGFENTGYFGTSAADIGDINNDGFDDILIGSKGYSDYTGRAYLYLGGNPMDTIADAVFTGEGTWNQFGCAVSSAGDVNNDGYPDFMIGANRYSSFTGRVYIYLGGTNIDTTADIILTGEAVANYFGSTITSEDINNDNYDDIIVGAYGFNGDNRGKVYLYNGGNPMDNIPDFTILGGNPSYSFGISVASVKNFNGDLFSDILIGADGANSGKGSAIVLFGGGIIDSIPDVEMNGESTSDNFGYSVSSAGDINNDGFDDIIVGDYRDSINGSAYIYYGRLVVGISKENDNFPSEFALNQNFPNPFNPTTTISYQIPVTSRITLKIFDILGKEVTTLVNAEQPQGIYEVEFNANNLSSGIYFYELKAGNFIETRKMILMK